ncbi:hypothetical protein ACH5RR_041185 [Cinchona calisaya]|uniref:Nucleoside phosphorylase domain-containing protein n=1 Tax=Cinchona calisaya TaxID=153742 RepID=A0ABD2XYA0_9GENT
MRVGVLSILLFAVVAFLSLEVEVAKAYLHGKTRALIDYANKHGPYLGIVIPNLYEMDPLIKHPSYKASNLVIDFQGRRFRFGTVDNRKAILVMTGLGVINAGITTQLLLALFDVNSVVHYGIAGNANSSLSVGDVTIAQYWAHTGLWNWQRYGAGPEDKLALEENGDYTRTIGFIKFAEYTKLSGGCKSADNYLNNVWYQPEEVFPIDGTPEDRQHAFWVPIDPHYYKLSKKLLGLKLDGCINTTTCLKRTPKVALVKRGVSSSTYLDNAAYRSFIFDKFGPTPVDMESASVALICLQQRKPFVIIRSLSDLAGGGSAESNEADTFSILAANNSVKVVVEFIKSLPK